MAFALLPNIPDLPFKHWGHRRYDISHSLFANLLLILGALSLLSWRQDLRHHTGGGLVLIGGIVAWLSHLLLDSFYNHGKGVAVFWPFSDAHLALPIPWFSVVPSLLPFTREVLQEYGIEFASCCPLLVLALSLRRAGIVQ
jgi:membrane-bound metal-dependent hydrolase YbcI (DUF457 family)